MLLEAAIYPGKKSFHVRFAMGKTVKRFGFAGERKPSDVVLDRVECADAPECLVHALSFCALSIDELAT